MLLSTKQKSNNAAQANKCILRFILVIKLFSWENKKKSFYFILSPYMPAGWFSPSLRESPLLGEGQPRHFQVCFSITEKGKKKKTLGPLNKHWNKMADRTQIQRFIKIVDWFIEISSNRVFDVNTKKCTVFSLHAQVLTQAPADGRHWVSTEGREAAQKSVNWIGLCVAPPTLLRDIWRKHVGEGKKENFLLWRKNHGCFRFLQHPAEM